MSQITTHVLDTATGKPAKGVSITLQKSDKKNFWVDMASGKTNGDGRIGDLLSDDKALKKGTYRMVFRTKAYFDKENTPCFYPEVSVVFVVKDNEHYHIPLLLSPFGYSTYRGS